MCHLSENALEELMMRPTECCDDRASIEEKTLVAQRLSVRWGSELRRDPYINDLLGRLEHATRTSKEAMVGLGIVEACKRCDEEEGGSCCGSGLENKFDYFLLLINVLLGVSLPEDRTRADSCYFLDEKGCMLKVRLVLCVDFLCQKILQRLTHNELTRLQNVSSDELVVGFMLYDAIKRILRRRWKADIV